MSVDFHELLEILAELIESADEVLLLASEDESRAKAWEADLALLEENIAQARQMLVKAGWMEDHVTG